MCSSDLSHVLLLAIVSNQPQKHSHWVYPCTTEYCIARALTQHTSKICDRLTRFPSPEFYVIIRPLPAILYYLNTRWCIWNSWSKTQPHFRCRIFHQFGELTSSEHMIVAIIYTRGIGRSGGGHSCLCVGVRRSYILLRISLLFLVPPDILRQYPRNEYVFAAIGLIRCLGDCPLG